MIYARRALYGMLWQILRDDGEELIQAWEHARTKYGAGALTGKVFARNSGLAEVRLDPSLPPGTWLFELRAQV